MKQIFPNKYPNPGSSISNGTRYTAFVTPVVLDGTWDEGNTGWVIPAAGSISNLTVTMDLIEAGTKTFSTGIVTTGNVVPSDGSPSVAIAAGNLTGTDATARAVNAGDMISIIVSGAISAANRIRWSYRFTPTASNQAIAVGGIVSPTGAAVPALPTNASDRFCHLFTGEGQTAFDGQRAWNQTESKVYFYCPTAGTITQFYVAASNTLTAPRAYEFSIYKNGAQVAASIVTFNPTGASNHSVGVTGLSIAFVAGDTITIAGRLSNSGGTASNNGNVSWGIAYSPTTDGESMFGGLVPVDNVLSVTQNVQQFDIINGSAARNATLTTTESNVACLVGEAMVVKKFRVDLAVAPGTNQSRQFRIRKSGSNGTLVVSISGSGVTGSDLVDQDLFAANDTIDIMAVALTTGCASTQAFWSGVMYIDPTGGTPTIGATRYNAGTNGRLTVAPITSTTVNGILDFLSLTGQRIYTFQDQDGTVPLLERAQSFTAKQTISVVSGAALIITSPGTVGIGQTTPTAQLHFAAGSTAASSAPIKLASGSLMTTAEVGAIEFLTDKYYGTITTGAARKEFTLNDGTLTSGRVPFATTNGRLTDDSDMTFATDTLTVTKIIASTSLTVSTLTSGRVTFAGASGILTDDSDFTFSVDTLTVTKIIGSTSITDSGLTATRLTFAGTAGLLSDSPNLTFVSPALTIGVATSTTGALKMTGATSGTVTVTVGATAGTWTLTLPAAVPTANDDIFVGSTAGIASWKSKTTLKILTPLFDHFADANNGTTVETDLYSDTLAAGQFATNGDKVFTQYGGTFTGDATSTQRLRMYFGGTLIFDSGALGIGAVTASWNMNATIVRESSSIVRCSVSLNTSFATLNAYATYTKVTGLTLANTQIVKITGTAAGVTGASNQITASEGCIEYEPAA